MTRLGLWKMARRNGRRDAFQGLGDGLDSVEAIRQLKLDALLAQEKGTDIETARGDARIQCDIFIVRGHQLEKAFHRVEKTGIIEAIHYVVSGLAQLDRQLVEVFLSSLAARAGSRSTFHSRHFQATFSSVCAAHCATS